MYDGVVDGPRAGTPGLVDDQGRLGALMNTFLCAPPIGGRQAALGAALRYEISLPRRTTEIIILTVLNDADSEYELAAHEWMGFEAGLNHDEIEALRQRREPELANPVERTAWRTTQTLVDVRDLDDAAYDAAIDTLGPRGLFELTTLVGFYQLGALQSRIFRIPRSAYTGTLLPPRAEGAAME